MYETIYNLIEKELKKKERYTYGRKITDIYILLLYTKHLCDKGELDYEKVTREENFNSTISYFKEHDFINEYLEKEMLDTALNKVIRMIQYDDLKELVFEFLKEQTPSPSLFPAFCDVDTRIVYLWTNDGIPNYDSIHPHVTYVGERYDNKHCYSFKNFKLLDEMLGFKRDYVERLENVDLERQDILLIHDEIPVYRFSKQDKGIIDSVYDLTVDYKEKIKKIVLQVSYRKVSIFSNLSLIRNWISKILFYKDNKRPDVYMEFRYVPLHEVPSKTISLLLLDDALTSDTEKIKKCITLNRTKKESFIKIKPTDIVDNNRRIGFKMYALDNKAEVKQINDIIDENSNYIRRLEDLNKRIESEVNKLIVK